MAARDLDSSLNPCVYIGDSDIDKEFSKNCSFDFIKIIYSRNQEWEIIENDIKFLAF